MFRKYFQILKLTPKTAIDLANWYVWEWYGSFLNEVSNLCDDSETFIWNHSAESRDQPQL